MPRKVFGWKVRRHKPFSFPRDRKSTRLHSSHTVIYTLSLHDALPICFGGMTGQRHFVAIMSNAAQGLWLEGTTSQTVFVPERSEEHTSALQSHSDLHSFPTRRSSDLLRWHDRTATFRRHHVECRARSLAGRYDVTNRFRSREIGRAHVCTPVTQ